MRTSFILHLDSLSILKKMPDDIAGKFIKVIYEYQTTGVIPEMDFALEMAVTPFINQFIRDGERYENVCERNKNNGLKGGRPKQTQPNPKNPVGYSETQQNPTEPKKPDNDNVNDNDSNNVNINDNKNNNDFSISDKSEKKQISYKQWTLEDFQNEMSKYKPNYPVEILMQFYDYWRELTPSGKMKLQLEKSWQTDLRVEKWFKNSHNFAPKNQKQTQKHEMGDALKESLIFQLNKIKAQ